MKLAVPEDKAVARKIAEGLVAQEFLCVWEGAVRSGKTVVALVAFAAYCIQSPGTNFLLSGRTVKTIERNAILEDFGLLNLIPGAEYKRVGEDRAIVFTVRTPEGPVRKKISVSGASDIRSYMQIRGNTYDGWFADEINMHDKEFVTEAMRRTAASKCRRHFWTLNPDSPTHWLYVDYLDKYMAYPPEKQAELGGVKLWLYTPEDNPIMTPAMLASLRAMYPEESPLYRRYILGERALAEGLIYSFIDKCVRPVPEGVKVRYAGIDFGTVHPTAMGWFGRDPVTKTYYLVREWVATPSQSESMTTAEYMDVFEEITAELGGIPRMNLTIDYGGGGEALVREAERRHWMPANPDKAVLDGIAITARLLHTGLLCISPECPKTIESMQLYHWDEKVSEKGGTAPVKMDDDPADMVRYVCTTFIDPRVLK